MLLRQGPGEPWIDRTTYATADVGSRYEGQCRSTLDENRPGARSKITALQTAETKSILTASVA